MLTEGDVVGKPSKGTKKDRRLKSNKGTKKKRKGSGSAKKLNKKKSAAFNKILVY